MPPIFLQLILDIHQPICYYNPTLTHRGKQMETLVTRDSLQKMLDEADYNRKGQIIGRALVALLNRQTASEQNSAATLEHNNIGFAGCDAKGGTLTAKSFLKWGRLLDWQIEKWTKLQRNGYSRICKYHAQLNEVANEKKR